jgi:hypothetical protein
MFRVQRPIAGRHHVHDDRAPHGRFAFHPGRIDNQLNAIHNPRVAHASLQHAFEPEMGTPAHGRDSPRFRLPLLVELNVEGSPGRRVSGQCQANLFGGPFDPVERVAGQAVRRCDDRGTAGHHQQGEEQGGHSQATGRRADPLTQGGQG